MWYEDDGGQQVVMDKRHLVASLLALGHHHKLSADNQTRIKQAAGTFLSADTSIHEVGAHCQRLVCVVCVAARLSTSWAPSSEKACAAGAPQHALAFPEHTLRVGQDVAVWYKQRASNSGRLRLPDESVVFIGRVTSIICTHKGRPRVLCNGPVPLQDRPAGVTIQCAWYQEVDGGTVLAPHFERGLPALEEGMHAVEGSYCTTVWVGADALKAFGRMIVFCCVCLLYVTLCLPSASYAAERRYSRSYDARGRT